MISFVLAAAWQVLLVGFGLVSALAGRARPERPDPAEAYELVRWRDRLEHYSRLREEELAELRRRDAVRATS